jgi:hypothetical protein
MGGGGGGGGTSFSAQGSPPGFDYATAMGLQQMAIGGDIQSYALSDQDFSNRYPALQDAYNQWQANLGQQVGQVSQGAQAQGGMMGGLANMIAGRQGAQTTSDISGIRNAAATAAGAAQPIFNLGAQQAGLAPQLQGLSGQQAGIGSQVAALGGGIAGMGATPYNLGQQLLNEPIDPQTQQQMMRAGLGSAAGALGAGSLGQGMAGQAAAARQLGLSTLQYGQAMRGEATQDIGLGASIAGQGGQLQAQAASPFGALGGAAQTLGTAGAQLAGGAQTYGTGANVAASAGGLSNLAQQAQESYGLNTAQLMNTYGGLQAQQATGLQGNMGIAGQLFPKRPFGLGGTNMAQSELGQTGAYNSFQQANYATMNGIAFNQAQIQAQQQQLQSSQSAGMMSAGVGAAGAVASAATAAALCWVARECLGTTDSRWKQFRLWLLNYAPASLRALYLRHGRVFAVFLSAKPLLKGLVKAGILGVLRTQQRRTRLLSLNLLFI